VLGSFLPSFGLFERTKSTRLSGADTVIESARIRINKQF
jgi:hypothetical protein